MSQDFLYLVCTKPKVGSGSESGKIIGIQKDPYMCNTDLKLSLSGLRLQRGFKLELCVTLLPSGWLNVSISELNKSSPVPSPHPPNQKISGELRPCGGGGGRGRIGWSDFLRQKISHSATCAQMF